MSDKHGSGRGRRGTVWRQMVVGGAVGKPLAEVAYLTPRYPAGVPASDLRESSPEVQRETAVIWFWNNLRPYDLTGRATFGFAGSTGPSAFNQSTFAPEAIAASSAIDTEFQDSLSQEVRQNIAEVLAGRWMWIDPPTVTPTVEPVNAAAANLAEVVSRLDELAATVRAIISAEGSQQAARAYGGIGHNSDELRPTRSMLEQCLVSIQQVKEGLISGGTAGVALAKRAWTQVAEVIKKVGVFVLGLAAAFLLNTATSAGHSFGTHLGDAAWSYANFWFQGHELTPLISHLLRL